MFFFLRFGLRNYRRVLLLIITVCGSFYMFDVYLFLPTTFRLKPLEQQYLLNEEASKLEVPPFQIDPKCLQELTKDNYAVEEEKEDFEFLKTPEAKDYKKILFYYHKYAYNNKNGAGHKIFEKSCCREKRCFLTDKKDKIPFKEFDAIIMQHSHLDFKIIPKERTREQRWIMFELEPPAYYTKGLEKYKNIFNWTMSYRRDSDILARYGYVYPKKDLPLKNFYGMEPDPKDLTVLVKKKKKLAAWLVSHCETNGGREIFVSELQKHMKVDIYGGCGPLQCGDFHHTTDCYKMFEEEYKFYFAFENSICADYVTEKLYFVLRYYVVPVVYGAGDYAAVTPPHSYINVKNFVNAQSLADYLLYLDSNDTAYMEYYKWREDYISTEGGLSKGMNLCRLCEKLHTDKEEKVYPDMKDWFLTKANCRFCGKIGGSKNNFTKCYDSVENFQNRNKIRGLYSIN